MHYNCCQFNYRQLKRRHAGESVSAMSLPKQQLVTARCRLLPVVLLAMLTISPASANEFYQLSLSGGNEDNVPRGLDSADRRDSNFARVQFSAGKLLQLGLDDTLTLGGSFNAARFTDFGGFDSLGYGVSADYGHKFGFGAYAPRLGAVLSFDHEELRGKARDNDLVTLELNFQKRLSPAWFFSAGIDYQSSRSDSLSMDPPLGEFAYDPDTRLPYELYDYDSASVFAELEYAFENGVLLTGGYRRIDGHTISSTLTPSLHLYKHAEAFYLDPAFDSPWYAYLLEANTDEWSVGVSLPVAIDSAIDVGYSWHDIQAGGGREYDNSLLTFTFVHGF